MKGDSQLPAPAQQILLDRLAPNAPGAAPAPSSAAPQPEMPSGNSAGPLTSLFTSPTAQNVMSSSLRSAAPVASPTASPNATQGAPPLTSLFMQNPNLLRAMLGRGI